MRILMISVCLAVFGLLSTTRAAAQQDASVIIDADIDLPFLKGSLPAGGASQPVKLDDPLTFKHQGKCYVIGCAEGPDCEKCTLYWKDLNGDGKVNPQKELRCRCNQDPEKECRLRGKEIPCQD